MTDFASLPDSASTPFPIATLRALLDRLIPSDEGFPGAIEAGVENYLARQFAGDCAHEAGRLARGLLQLETESIVYSGIRFVSLESGRQDALLVELEAGRTLSAWPADLPAAVFFARMVDLAHEGFYADPANGGNRERVSWRMIGYETRLPAGMPPVVPGSSPKVASRSDPNDTSGRLSE